jgi:hypothetical protein
LFQLHFLLNEYHYDWLLEWMLNHPLDHRLAMNPKKLK